MNKAIATIALISAASAISLEGMTEVTKNKKGITGVGKHSDMNTYSINDGITSGVISQHVAETVGSIFMVCVDPCIGCMFPWVKVTDTYTYITEVGKADHAGCVTYTADFPGLNTIKYTWGTSLILYFNVTVSE